MFLYLVTHGSTPKKLDIFWWKEGKGLVRLSEWVPRPQYEDFKNIKWKIFESSAFLAL